jgi:glutaredoxin-like protein
MQNREGQNVPQVTFKTRSHGDWVDVTSTEIFDGKTVVLFSLPGAFTPTCSATHLPRYNELAKTFRDNGVDEIVCVSVNDGFIMEQWQNDQDAWNIRLLPDGNGEFTKGMDMLVDKSNIGFGKRSWRYSMLVRDGVVEKMFIEPEVEGDPFGQSDADTMLGYLNPDATLPQSIAIVSRAGCPHCARAKKILDSRDLPYEEIQIGRDISQHSLRGLAGSGSVPQVFIAGRLIGGADDLEAHFKDD